MSSGSASPVAIGIGTVLASRYVVERELGVGGMATVLQVKDLRTERTLALKVLKPDVATHPEAVERFRREGEFLLSLKHPALIAVEAIGQLADGRLYLAMELLSGETLGERIRRGRLSPAEISPILAGSAVGLDAAHKAGVVHRDLKPDNIFLSTPRPGMTVQVKLLDFGISKIDGRASLTRTGQVLGTPRYMAPEQLRGEDDLDERIDVYALGVILYEALAGTPAFPATAPSDLIVSILHARYTALRALRPDISPELEAVVARAMSKSRQARFESAIELAKAWFEVVHRDDGPQSVRAGVATNVFGSVLESLRPASGFTPDDLRPATFREFEARLAVRGAATRHMDAVEGLPKLAENPAMASPERTTPAHLVRAELPPASALLAERRADSPERAASNMVAAMPVFQMAPLASLVADELGAGGFVAPNAEAAPGRAFAGVAATVPAHVALAAVAEENARRAAAAPLGNTQPRDAAVAVQPRREPAPLSASEEFNASSVPTRRPWGVIIGACLLFAALFAYGAYTLFGAVTRAGTSRPPVSGATPAIVMPRLPSFPIVPAASPNAVATDAGMLTLVSDAAIAGDAAVNVVNQASAARVVASPIAAAPATDHHTSHHDASSPSDHPAPDPWTSSSTSSMTDPSRTASDGARLLADARAALAAGNARRCVELATEAIAAGVDSSVYRVRGDCYRALSDSPHALRSYQRFCTLAPNSSQIATVRRLASELGGTCP